MITFHVFMCVYFFAGVSPLLFPPRMRLLRGVALLKYIVAAQVPPKKNTKTVFVCLSASASSSSSCGLWLFGAAGCIFNKVPRKIRPAWPLLKNS